MFDVRALVVAECMAAVSGVTVVLALLRNGLPPLVTGVAVASCWLVVLVQVLAIVMTWSVRSPYSVDLLLAPRDPRAARRDGRLRRPALARHDADRDALHRPRRAAVGWAPAVVAVPFLAWSTRRLLRARRRWLAGDERARVVLTVAAV